MAKVIDGAEISIQVWSTIILSAEEIQEIYPEFADWNDGDDEAEMEQAIEDHITLHYLDYIDTADGALDDFSVRFDYEDDGSE